MTLNKRLKNPSNYMLATKLKDQSARLHREFQLQINNPDWQDKGQLAELVADCFKLITTLAAASSPVKKT